MYDSKLINEGYCFCSSTGENLNCSDCHKSTNPELVEITYLSAVPTLKESFNNYNYARDFGQQKKKPQQIIYLNSDIIRYMKNKNNRGCMNKNYMNQYGQPLSYSEINYDYNKILNDWYFDNFAAIK